MQIIRNLRKISGAARGTVVALGNFDGVHLGHSAIIAECKKQAKALGKPCAVMTFEPHPREYFRPDMPPLRMMSFREKAAALKEQGVDILFVGQFNETFVNLSAQQFIDDILVGGLAASHIITGEDYSFGKARSGNSSLLNDAQSQGKFGYTQFSPVVASGANIKISSTTIRELLARGEIENANALLSKPYNISGCVIHGDARGRELGYPTANIRLVNRFLPKFGIYIIKTNLNGKILRGVSNLGIRPMFETPTPLLENYFFDFNGDVYGKKLNIEFLHYLRPEMNFSDLSELKKHMRDDCVAAQKWLELKND